MSVGNDHLFLDAPCRFSMPSCLICAFHGPGSLPENTEALPAMRSRHCPPRRGTGLHTSCIYFYGRTSHEDDFNVPKKRKRSSGNADRSIASKSLPSSRNVFFFPPEPARNSNGVDFFCFVFLFNAPRQ